MHFILNHQLFNDAVLIAEKAAFPVSQIDIFVASKNDPKQLEQQKVYFLSEKYCRIDGTDYKMSHEVLIDDSNGYKQKTTNFIVWLIPQSPAHLN